MLGFLAGHIPCFDAEIWRAFLIPLQFVRNFHLNACHVSYFRLHCVEWPLFEVCLALYSAVSPLQINDARKLVPKHRFLDSLKIFPWYQSKACD